jgi:hypothetical protein
MDVHVFAISDKSPAISSHFSFAPLTSPESVRYDKPEYSKAKTTAEKKGRVS